MVFEDQFESMGRNVGYFWSIRAILNIFYPTGLDKI